MADFQARQDALDKKAAALFAEYKTLLDEIAASGKHYANFRRLKETVFGLEKVNRRNGVRPEKTERNNTPNNAQFVRSATNPPAFRSTATPPPVHTVPDLFNKAANREKKREQTEVNNPAPPPDLFSRKAKTSEPPPPIPSKKKRGEPDPKRKVLASSEEKDAE